MDSVNLQVLKSAHRWMQAGYQAVLGTVIATWGSAPRPVGSLVVIREDGLIIGSVSGGCIEDDLVEGVRRKTVAWPVTSRVKYGVTAEEAFRFGLPCGGTIEILLESLAERSQIGPLLTGVEQSRHTRRTLVLATGVVTLEESEGADVFACDDDTLIASYGPRWRLLLIGAGQLTHYLAHMALACDYEVAICDPRSEYADAWSVPGSQLLRTMPDDTVLQLAPDPHVAIVALTHDPKLDDMALIEALQSQAFYVGAIGSHRNQVLRKQRLKEFGVTDKQLERLHGPVGVKNGARTPPEIAASIITEITAAKYGYVISAPLRI